MCNKSRLERRRNRHILGRDWRQEAQQDATLPDEMSDVFLGEEIDEVDLVLPAGALAFSADPEDVDPDILRVAGIVMVEDGLPFGLHIIPRAELRASNLGYAA